MKSGKNLKLLLQLLDGIEEETTPGELEVNDEQAEGRIYKRLNELHGISEKILKSIKHSSKDLLSISECSEYFNISKSLLYKKTSKKELPFYKFGGIIFFRKTELKDHILSNPQK